MAVGEAEGVGGVILEGEEAVGDVGDARWTTLW